MGLNKYFLRFLLAVILFGLVYMAVGCSYDRGSDETRQPPSLSTSLKRI